VSRRLSALLLPLIVVGLLACCTTRTEASVMSFRLTETDSPGAAPVQRVLASIIPPGTVIPPDPATSPLTVLAGSSGFNPDDLKVSLGDGTTPSGTAFQALALDFGAGGLSPGGRVYFSLNVSPSFTGMLTLLLPSSVSNLAIESYTPPPGVGPIGGGTGANVPEPVSILMWTGVATFGLLRARSRRKSRNV
jgi:hypothetical protein